MKEANNTCFSWPGWSSCSWHGLSNAASTKKIGRLIWLIVFFISTSICVYFFQLRIRNYISAPINLSRKEENIATGLQIPEITICQTNSFDNCEYMHLVDIIRREIQTVITDYHDSNFSDFTKSIAGYLQGRPKMEEYLRNLKIIDSLGEDYVPFTEMWKFTKKFGSSFVSWEDDFEEDEDIENLASEMVFDFMRTENLDLLWESYGDDFKKIFKGKLLFLDKIKNDQLLFNEFELVNEFIKTMFGVDYTENWWKTASTHKFRADWSDNKLENSLLVVAEMIQYLDRVILESELKSAWMTDVGNFENMNVLKPEGIKRYYSGLRYFKKQLRNFDVRNLTDYFDNFKISDSFQATKFRGYKNLLSIELGESLNNIYPDDVFKPTFTRESHNCVKMDKRLVQRTQGDYLSFMMSAGRNYYTIGMERIFTNLLRSPKTQLWLDVKTENDNLPSLSQTAGNNIGLDNWLGYNARAVGNEIVLTQKRFLRMLKEDGGSCDVPDEIQRPVKECLSICFLEKIERSEECGCILAWGMERHLNKTWDNRGKIEGQEMVNECTFETFSSSSCFNFITELKTDLVNKCNCKIPCKETVLEISKSAYSYEINGQLIDIQLKRELKKLSQNVKNNSADNWSSELAKYRNSNETNQITHSKLSNMYLEKQLRTYALLAARSFEDKVVKYYEVLTGCFIHTDIFYGSMQIEEFKEVFSDQWSSLVSDFGGQLGLWVGISMTNVVEGFIFVYWLFLVRSLRK